jgi:hypothetical protein
MDDVIDEIIAQLEKLKTYGLKRYNQGVADERARTLVAIQGMPGGLKRIPLVLPKPNKSKIDIANRQRAPRGLAREMVLRSLSAVGSKGTSSRNVSMRARTPAEKMVSIEAIRNEFRILKGEGRCELREGRWYPTGGEK